MSHIFPRHSKQRPPEIVSGKDCYLFDASGKRYLDGSGGAGVSSLGHGNEVVNQAIEAQLKKIAFAHTGFFTSAAAERLADLLIQQAPEGIDRVMLVSGGSEAVEAGIKLARQYFLERGEPQRRHLIARRQSYHGNTLGALAAGGNAWRREKFAPLLFEASHIAPCFEYADRRNDETSRDYGRRVADELEHEIVRLGPQSVVGFLAEPVVGATAGAVPAVDGYFTRIRQICDRYGILLILDEVMCGMGRTGYLFASEHDAVRPDIVCLAKGLGAGYQPIGAMLCSAEVYGAIEKGSGFFQHGHTYIGHPVAAAAGCAVLGEIYDRHLVKRVRSKGSILGAALRARFAEHPYVGDIRGRGLFWGLEFVTDRSTKTPFDPSLKLAAAVKSAAFDHGLICYPMAGTRDGVQGDHVLLAPPFIIDDHQIDELVDKLDQAVRDCLPA